MAALSRFSDQNIDDDVLRGVFYNRILAYVADPTAQVTKHDIKHDEEYRPDLVSYRLYNTPDLRWLVLLMCDVQDEADPLPVAETVSFPSSVWVRQAMRDFISEMGI